MWMDHAAASITLDFGTLFVAAVVVTLLLGLFLLFAWVQERIPALAWWGAAYLVGGFSGAVWRFGDTMAPVLPSGVAHVLLFIAVGMIWSAARLFHGRPVLWGAMCFGAAVWVLAFMFAPFARSGAAHVVLSSFIVAGYTFLIATELGRERRQSLIRCWPAIFVPMLHGAIFLFPVALATLSGGGRNLAGGWLVVFMIEIVLYVVGAAFIVLILAKDRTVHLYKMAAATDPLTGALNRRGFFEAAEIVMGRSRARGTPVSALAFDLDHFKSINDRLGHGGGDAVLRRFATMVRTNLRTDDIIGRLGGEEFVALLPSTLDDAAVAAERVRAAFAEGGAEFNGLRIAATVSVGVACGSPWAAVDALIARADAALYGAKANGRNRVELVKEAVAGIADRQDRQARPPICQQLRLAEETGGPRRYRRGLSVADFNDDPRTFPPGALRER